MTPPWVPPPRKTSGLKGRDKSFDQRPSWQPEEIPLGDDRILDLDDT